MNKTPCIDRMGSLFGCEVYWHELRPSTLFIIFYLKEDKDYYAKDAIQYVRQRKGTICKELSLNMNSVQYVNAILEKECIELFDRIEEEHELQTVTTVS